MSGGAPGGPSGNTGKRPVSPPPQPKVVINLISDSDDSDDSSNEVQSKAKRVKKVNSGGAGSSNAGGAGSSNAAGGGASSSNAGRVGCLFPGLCKKCKAKTRSQHEQHMWGSKPKKPLVCTLNVPMASSVAGKHPTSDLGIQANIFLAALQAGAPHALTAPLPLQAPAPQLKPPPQAHAQPRGQARVAPVFVPVSVPVSVSMPVPMSVSVSMHVSVQAPAQASVQAPAQASVQAPAHQPLPECPWDCGQPNCSYVRWLEEHCVPGKTPEDLIYVTPVQDLLASGALRVHLVDENTDLEMNHCTHLLEAGLILKYGGPRPGRNGLAGSSVYTAGVLKAGWYGAHPANTQVGFKFGLRRGPPVLRVVVRAQPNPHWLLQEDTRSEGKLRRWQTTGVMMPGGKIRRIAQLVVEGGFSAAVAMDRTHDLDECASACCCLLDAIDVKWVKGAINRLDPSERGGHAIIQRDNQWVITRKGPGGGRVDMAVGGRC